MPPVNMRDPASGEVYVVDEADVGARLSEGWQAEDAGGRVDRVTQERLEDEYGGISGGIAASGAAVLRGVSAGGTDFVFDKLGAGKDIRHLRDQHATLSTGGEIGGAVVGAAFSGGSSLAASTPVGLATRAGTAIARTGEGASAAVRGARLVAGGAFEGGVDAIGQAITQATIYDNPLDVENLGASILTNALIGGGGNVAAAAAGKALRTAKGKLDDFASRASKQADVADDLSKLSSKELGDAEKIEVAAALERRKPEQVQFVDDLKAHRQSLSDEKIWLATKDADAKAVGNVKEIAKINYDADKSIRSMLNNPKNLAENPRRALEALQRQENALEMLAKNEGDLRKAFAADATGERAASLDALPGALERNRGLQAKVREFMAPPSSPRLDQIAAARDALQTGGRESFLGKAAAGAAFAGASGLAYESGLPGASYLAPLVGAAAANAITGKLGAKLTAASVEATQRTSKAIGMFLDVGKRIAPVAPVLATKVYQAAKYATDDEKPKATKAKAKPRKESLADGHKRVTGEIKQHTAYVDGRPKARPEYRQKVAAQLAPVAQMSPILADRLETLAARKMEYLARKIPRHPDIAAIQTGPDTWQPSDFEMRSFARTIAAVEDPHGVVERLVDGSVTPEDAEALREVYPEIMADVTQQILERLPELQKNLPYERRLALSIFSGVPVDPALDPRVLSVLQASFANEPGTEGGMQAPRAQPAFGSVKAESATPAQERSG